MSLLYNYKSIMGATDSSQLQQALQQNANQQNQQPHVLVSPSEAYAIKCRQKGIEQLFPGLVTSIEKVKKIQNYEGVVKIVQKCPIYYLKHLSCYYQGQWKDCLPHGSGLAVYKNGSYYEGQFQQGELVSDDALYYFGGSQESLAQKPLQKSSSRFNQQSQDLSPIRATSQKQELGTYYIGRFVDSKFNGKGKLVHKEIIYEGDWENGRRQGVGKQFSLEQNFSYEGQFVNSFKFGNGVYTRRINDNIYSYEGTFYAGRFHGLGKLSIDGSEIFKGRFLNGKAEGEGTLHCEEGTLKGIFQKDRVKGPGQFFFNSQAKDDLTGNFTDKIGAGGYTRKILHQGLEISDAVHIQFESLMI